MNKDFITAIDSLVEEKNIDKEELLEAIESSIKNAYQKNDKNHINVDVSINRDTGEIAVYENKEVVEKVDNPNTQILYEIAKQEDPNIAIGDKLRVTFTPKDFGRIAAQNARQLIVQRIKEAEKNLIYNEYADRLEEIINGTITRIDRDNVYINIGRTEAVLPSGEQVKTESYNRGDRLKVYLLSVKKTNKGPQIKVSRSHPGLVKRLFEDEVPEFADGTLDIVNVSREPGLRSKIAVKSYDDSIDPVGACVGQKGIRVQNIINELDQEKIDIIAYSDNIEKYLENALSPAKIEKIITNKKEKKAIVIVDDFQLSLAIGKEGQNVRLAAKLTGWKIDIKAENEFDEILKENPNFINEFTGNKVVQTQTQKDSLAELLEDDMFREDQDFTEEELDLLDSIINSEESVEDLIDEDLIDSEETVDDLIDYETE